MRSMSNQTVHTDQGKDFVCGEDSAGTLGTSDICKVGTGLPSVPHGIIDVKYFKWKRVHLKL